MNIFDKIIQIEKDKIAAGKIAPFFVVVSSKEAQEIMAPGRQIEIIFFKPDPIEKLMSKIPGMMGKYSNTYIIQSFLNREEIKQGALAKVVLNKIDKFYSDRAYQDDTLVMVTRDWLKYYKEHQDE